jgi:hypothetical protein
LVTPLGDGVYIMTGVAKPGQSAPLLPTRGGSRLAWEEAKMTTDWAGINVDNVIGVAMEDLSEKDRSELELEL